ncbi:unnamed protein product (macronuclear) [Paramecium tetraurelia]|uniref:Uncharacterized protein n=1 Tax=Paramecium tetraurelia TaxID=5888 RepID=A0C971_PARTE|nr:uncharacterized protein GSPATT00006644001 [Paramecium tetraurelia]CAK67338.1 unnamed protein product [Paramecium tetraurelia]|eukprot:XP_001434735.1 hypothetical protein (macronuclear) [Paramecium tetraurelia strain d4-2]
MILNDSLPQLKMEKTAQFFNPRKTILKQQTLRKLQPIVDEQTVKEFSVPTFSKKLSQKEIIDFDQIVQQQLQIYNSQTNILQINQNFNNLHILKSSQQSKRSQTPLKSLLEVQERLLLPKYQSTHLAVNEQSKQSTPEKYRRNIRVLLNPFNFERKSQEKQQNRSSSQSLRPSKSQGRTFLQRKAQVGVLNRIFSSRSQEKI